LEQVKITAITQARTGSTRLPGKILMKVGDITLLELHLKRVLSSAKINEVIVATTTNKEDLEVVEIANRLRIKSYQGSENDVLDRFYQALQSSVPDYVVRVTSDCPLIDPKLIDKVIEYTIEHKLDYCSNTLDPHYPDGQDVEVFRFASLKQAWEQAKLTSEREHVTPYIWKNSSFKGGSIFLSDNFKEDLSFGHLRMTVDEREDFKVITEVVNTLGTEKTWLDYAEFLERNAVRLLNENITRNEGYTKSLKKEE
jgi:spore coat polysaccharide biosynthesis protein SpsF (cytidylyltransferase family)